MFFYRTAEWLSAQAALKEERKEASKEAKENQKQWATEKKALEQKMYGFWIYF